MSFASASDNQQLDIGLFPTPPPVPVAPRPEGAPQFHIKRMDCVAGLRQMEAESVDVVVTSPPYNLGIDYSTYQDSKSHPEYLDWCAEWAREIFRVLKEDGSFFLNIGASSSNPAFPFEVMLELRRRCGFHLQNTIHWIKSISIEREEGVTSFGHFKPINSDRFINDCQEYVFHLTKTGRTKLNRLGVGVPYQDKSNIARWGHTGGKDKRCRGNTWFIPYKTIQERAKDRPHPATFPIELAVKCIRLHGREDSTVVDPFLGIGHSACAAQECSDLVKEFIGFDIDEEYLNVAIDVLHRQYGRADVELMTPTV
jgi:site-specific DNA-methyltransferase (adenine-specific)